MIIGLSTYNPDRDFLNSLARAGIDCVELSLPGREYAGFDYAAFATRARDAGLDIRSFHLPFYLAPEDGPVDPASLDADVRKRTAEVHARFVRTAASVGARLAVVHACLEQDSEPRRIERIARAKESLVSLADVAEPLGVTVCVEDLPRTCLGNTAEELADIISCDDRLRICFDVNHLLFGSHADFLRLLGPKIVATHISDYDFVNERHWLPGEGKIDWPALMDGLDAAGYAGAFTYELGFKGDPRTVARSRDLTPEDIVRNAREIEARHTLTVIGGGGLPNLPMEHFPRESRSLYPPLANAPPFVRSDIAASGFSSSAGGSTPCAAEMNTETQRHRDTEVPLEAHDRSVSPRLCDAVLKPCAESVAATAPSAADLVAALRHAMDSARSILWIFDNCGEAVLDRPLMIQRGQTSRGPGSSGDRIQRGQTSRGPETWRV